MLSCAEAVSAGDRTRATRAAADVSIRFISVIRGDGLLYHGLKLVFTAEPRGHFDDLTGAVDVEGHRQHFGVAEVSLVILRFGQEDRIGNAELVGALGDRVFSYFGVVGDADYFKSLAGVFFVELLQPRHLDLAWIAIGSPEVQEKWMAFEVLKRDLLAAQIDKRKVRGGLAAKR